MAMSLQCISVILSYKLLISVDKTASTGTTDHVEELAWLGGTIGNAFHQLLEELE